MHYGKTNKIHRADNSELPDDLKPITPVDPPKPPSGTEEITERFVLFGGDPTQLNDAASIASAGLVVAEQIRELTNAIHMLSFLLCKNQ